MSNQLPKSKPYFHDRLILLILSINTFLAMALIISALLALSDTNAGYIREYRSNLGLDGYRGGELKDILAFAVFAVVVYVFQLITSIKIYHIRKHISLIILVLTMLLYIFSLLVVNALSNLR